MKIIKQDDGFTLIEVLVTISLSAIAITLIFSFYLFAGKFISTVTSSFEKNQKVNQFIFNLQDTINKSNGFIILIDHNMVIINLENNKKLIFTDSTVSLDNYYEIKDMSNYNFSINLENNESIVVSSKAHSSVEQKEINASEISNMDITIIYDDNKYNVTYNKPMISTLRFVNIK